MKTEELAQELNFDAHEFDGLRADFQDFAETMLGRVDRFVRENPMLCAGIAVAAGCALGCFIKSRPASSSEEIADACD